MNLFINGIYLRMLNPDQKICRTKDRFLASMLGNEMVMMDTINGNYIGLNAVSCTIWNHLEHELTVTELISKLLAEYEVDLSACEQETLYCLNKMVEQGLVATT